MRNMRRGSLYLLLLGVLLLVGYVAVTAAQASQMFGPGSEHVLSVAPTEPSSFYSEEAGICDGGAGQAIEALSPTQQSGCNNCSNDQQCKTQCCASGVGRCLADGTCQCLI